MFSTREVENVDLRNESGLRITDFEFKVVLLSWLPNEGKKLRLFYYLSHSSAEKGWIHTSPTGICTKVNVTYTPRVRNWLVNYYTSRIYILMKNNETFLPRKKKKEKGNFYVPIHSECLHLMSKLRIEFLTDVT